MTALADKVGEIHFAKYGARPTTTAYAPGRVEVLGNHTDYNGGTVLAFAIDMGITFCVSSSSVPGFRVFAVDLDETAEFSLVQSHEGKGPGWGEYIRGVIYHLGARGIEVSGVDCTFSGSLPLGCGLSSSAALEVAAAKAFLNHSKADMDPLEIARICRDAEQEFAGNNCGLLDQLTSINGKENTILHLDFSNLSVSHVEVPTGAGFLLVDTGSKHSLVESEYNLRREVCTEASNHLGRLLDRKVTCLGDVTMEEFLNVRADLKEAEAKYAWHVIGEIHRVAKGIECLACGDLRSFGELMYASHQSSKVEFENSCEELDLAVECARDAGALGARLTGGGFGGSVIVLAEEEQVKVVSDAIIAGMQKKGIKGKILPVVASAGARIVNSLTNSI